VKWASIALIQVIGSIHQAVKKDAVLDSKHMSGFMRQNPATPAQYERIPIRSSDSIKSRIIPGKAEYSNAIGQRRLTENEVPGWSRIEIAHCDSDDTEPVRGQYLPQMAEYVSRQQLWLAGVRIWTRCDLSSRYTRCGQRLNREAEEGFGKLRELVKRRRILSFKIFEWLHVDCVSKRIGSVGPGLNEVGESLARLRMNRQPVICAGQGNRLEVSSRKKCVADMFRQSV
jgi:hypothetical protein